MNNQHAIQRVANVTAFLTNKVTSPTSRLTVNAGTSTLSVMRGLVMNTTRQSSWQKQAYCEPCYVCERIIHTDRDFGFSSTIRHGNGRVWFHLDCGQEGDPLTDVEVEAESAKYS